MGGLIEISNDEKRIDYFGSCLNTGDAAQLLNTILQLRRQNVQSRTQYNKIAQRFWSGENLKY